MKHKNEDLLEFQEVPGKSEPGYLARESYRVPVRGKERFLLVIGNDTYPLVDISSRGVSISMDATTSIASQGIISDCNIILDEKIFEGLDGEVIHYSIDNDGSWLCGIAWLNIDADTVLKIEETLLAIRNELFEYV